MSGCGRKPAWYDPDDFPTCSDDFECGCQSCNPEEVFDDYTLEDKYLDDDATGFATSNNEPHAHHCSECGGVWSHNDESCVGPRMDFQSPVVAPPWDCPACQGVR